MTARGLIGFLFVLYCIEVGTLLVILPWSPHWDRLAVGMPSVALQVVFLRSWVRGAVTGFGLLHLPSVALVSLTGVAGTAFGWLLQRDATRNLFLLAVVHALAGTLLAAALPLSTDVGPWP